MSASSSDRFPRQPGLIMGLWAAGGMWWGPVDDRESRAAIHAALDRGLTTFDTAPVYGLGHSEKLLGKALQGVRPEVTICTKVGLVWNASGQVTVNLNPASLEEELNLSLRRLRTDYIDLYQIHWPGDNFQAEQVMPILEDMRTSGKIRWIGVSNFNREQLEEASRFARIDALQPPFNLLNTVTEQKLLPWCRELDVAVLAYGPLARGLLTGKYGLEPPQFGKRDIRSGDANFRGKRYQRIQRFVAEDLQPLAAELNLSVAGLVLSWTLSVPGMTHAIAGIKTADQVRQNSEAQTLDRELFTRIDRKRKDMLRDIENMEESWDR